MALARPRLDRSGAGAARLLDPLACLVPDCVCLTGDLGRGVYRIFGELGKLITEFVALHNRTEVPLDYSDNRSIIH